MLVVSPCCSWTPGPAFPLPIVAPSAVSFNGTVFVFGGATPVEGPSIFSNNTPLSTTWTWRAGNETWTALPYASTAPPGRAGHAASLLFTDAGPQMVVFSGAILLLGGPILMGLETDMWMLDVTTRVWSNITSIASPCRRWNLHWCMFSRASHGLFPAHLCICPYLYTGSLPPAHINAGVATLGAPRPTRMVISNGSLPGFVGPALAESHEARILLYLTVMTHPESSRALKRCSSHLQAIQMILILST